ncbi:hypothetical protein CJ030_MR7G015969 [Morella rubra]|uniref:Uncharacterized protein n=1 Tax=Morella rubra TaxID=262757 RepID=A0A6A1V1I8_9ROSI|nr:hypothetical protein CJ030_MR7G015969 [Morella rubra]
MKRGREFPSVTSGQLHSSVTPFSMSPILSPTPSAPSPRVNEGMSQGTPACPSSYASTSASKQGEGLIPISVNKWVDVPAEVKEYIMDRVLKRSEQNKKNRSKLTVNHATGSRSFQRTRACMKNKKAAISILQSCIKRIIQTKMGFGPRKEREKFIKGKDEIEAMRAAREKDLQEFAKKQAEMEATLRDHREEQRVEQERIRLEQEERMKRSKSACEWSTRSTCKSTRSACKRSKSAYGRNIKGAGEENVLCNGEENERHVKATIQPVWGFKKVDACIL